ncbi:MAG: hypothetical protein AB3X41_05570 [Leptothrix ochracea]|uniref:hypothetical protein n=1 Tax=Leptothrix ochracea TaxID=735331 RepID=UPI0034E1D71D
MKTSGINKLAHVLAVSLALTAGTVVVAEPHNDTEEAVYFAPTAAPYGTSFPEWTAQWWQFVASMPPAIHPLLDPSGEACAIGQRGPVWFLFGNFGGVTQRACTIPANKALFFPLLNAFAFDSPGVCGQDAVHVSVTDLRTLVAPWVTGAQLSAQVDGVPIRHLERFRHQSVVFSISTPNGDLFCNLPQATYGPAVDDGYYVMLKPLPPGDHVVHFQGAQGTFSLDVTYQIKVLPM